MHVNHRRALRGTAVAGAALAVLAAGLTPAFAAGPATTVTPATAANPDGQDFHVTGSGFSATANNGVGIYVAFGPKTDAYATDASVYEKALWVSPSGAAGYKLNTDGTFDLDLTGIKAKYTDGGGKAWDCLTTQCYIITIAAHGSSDRGQDSFTPVTFSGGEDPTDPAGPGEPSGGSAGQTVTTTVTGGGALSLAVAGDSVALSKAAAGGHSTGSLRTATVTDARGTDAGWNLVGQLTDLDSAAGGSIPAANMSWAPSLTALADGSTGQATAGPRVTGLDQARTLSSATAGTGAGVFEANAALDLLIPAGADPGEYAGTLTLTLS